MKILLIRPFYHISKFTPDIAWEPLCLEYIASVIRESHNVSIFDCIAEHWTKIFKYPDDPNIFHLGASVKDVQKKIRKYSPDVVGITSTLFTQAHNALRIADIVKEIDPEILTVIGGNHPSYEREKLLEENKNIDVVVYGEGELTFKELLDNNLQNLEDVDGIAYRKNNEIKLNKPRQLIANLDEIPFPSRDLVPYKNYSRMIVGSIISGGSKSLGHTARKLLINNFYGLFANLIDVIVFKKTGVPLGSSVITSRGCPYRCYFCSIHNTWGYKYRMRSAENVLDELTLLYEKYRVRHIDFLDDNLTVSKKRVIEICKGIIERDIDLSLSTPSGVHLASLDEEVLTWMKKAGFEKLHFGIESGNQRIQDTLIKKGLKLSNVSAIIQACKKLDIQSTGYFVVGMPGETIKTMKDTLNFVLTSDLDFARVFTCQPYPGSRLYEDCKNYGYLSDGFELKNLFFSSDTSFIKTPEFAPKDVENVINELRTKIRERGMYDWL